MYGLGLQMLRDERRNHTLSSYIYVELQNETCLVDDLTLDQWFSNYGPRAICFGIVHSFYF